MADLKICICGCGVELIGRQSRYASNICAKRVARDRHLQKTFNITQEDYDRIFEYQNGRCGICKRPPRGGKALAVDHRHINGSEGPVTGLLCFLCNRRFLGARKEEIIIAMYEYITNPPAEAALGREVIAPGKKKKKRQPRKRDRRK